MPKWPPPPSSPSAAPKPEDTAKIGLLLGMPGVYEDLLQTPYASNASRVEYHQKIDTLKCRLVAVVGNEIIRVAGARLPWGCVVPGRTCAC